jgi:hypothetical protein
VHSLEHSGSTRKALTALGTMTAVARSLWAAAVPLTATMLQVRAAMRRARAAYASGSRVYRKLDSEGLSTRTFHLNTASTTAGCVWWCLRFQPGLQPHCRQRACRGAEPTSKPPARRAGGPGPPGACAGVRYTLAACTCPWQPHGSRSRDQPQHDPACAFNLATSGRSKSWTG